MVATHGATKKRFVIAAMLFISVVINYLDRSNLSIVAPGLAHSLHLSPAKMGLIFSGFGWTYALLQVPTSRLVDRFSPRFLYTAMLMLWSIATMALGFASSFATLLVLRLLVGAFEAPAYPINNRVASTWFGENERAGAIGFYTSGQFAGLAFLTPLFSWIGFTHGWRSIFYLTGAVGIAWGVVWFLFFREPTEFRGVNQEELDFIAANGGLPDLEKRGAQHHSSFWKDLRFILSKQKLWAMYIGQFGLVSVQWFFLTWFPSYIVNSRHLPMSSGLTASLPFVGAFIGVITGGFVSDGLLRRGYSLTAARKIPIIFGLLLSTSIVGANYVNSQSMITAIFTCAYFGSAFASFTWSLVSTIAPQRLIGLTGGLFNFFGNLSAIVVPTVVGLLIRGADFTRALAFVSVTALIGAVCYLGPVGKIERIEEPA